MLCIRSCAKLGYKSISIIWIRCTEAAYHTRPTFDVRLRERELPIHTELSDKLALCIMIRCPRYDVSGHRVAQNRGTELAPTLCMYILQKRIAARGVSGPQSPTYVHTYTYALFHSQQFRNV